ncbi:DUF503 domain-containing protein [Motilibacter aurantiacus]|uniref:DUF503 domain-containing protein n=1 Tax=Motilibacter aurantiacus TaxID=2714955 RepID=UPI00140CD766|nr:DUF503 domain-containing protein [Motilibacter aurantiacus]
MFVGTLRLDLLLGDVHSLKAKRSVVRPIVAELARKFGVSVAEAGALDLHRRAVVGVAVVAADARHCREVLESCERLVAGRPEVDLLSAQHRVLRPEDDLAAVEDAYPDGG